MILSIPLSATTHETIANTQSGVSLITQEMKVSIPPEKVSAIDLSWSVSSFFP